MKIEEAIEHCQEVIDTCEDDICRSNHVQLKEWLTELVEYRRLYGNEMPRAKIVTQNVEGDEDWKTDEFKPENNV